MTKKTVLHVALVFLLCSLICILPVAAVDDIPPTVVSSDPADGQLHVPIDISSITITFSEDIQWDPSTPPYMSVELLDWNYDEQPIGDITVNGNVLTIHAPASPTPWLKNWDWPTVQGMYDLRVTNVKDTAGNVMESSYRALFKTVPYDTTPPSVISTSPTADTSDVPTGVIITAVMSEEINKCTGSVEMVDSHNNPVTLLGTYGYDTTDYVNLVITPKAPLNIGETYTVTIKEIKDGYQYSMVAPYSWSFTVVSPPTVVSTYPANGASNVPADVTITATMDESINRCIGTVEIRDHSGNLVESTWDAPDYLTLEITPTDPLVLGETYTVTIQGLDHKGIVMETPYSWSFTVKTSAEAVQDLSNKVDALGLPTGIENGLIAKLAAANMQISQKKYTPSRNMLNAFINQVNAQSGKAISSDQANDLISTAEQIINSIPAK